MTTAALRYGRAPTPRDPFGEGAAIERFIALLIFAVIVAVLLKEWGLLNGSA